MRIAFAILLAVLLLPLIGRAQTTQNERAQYEQSMKPPKRGAVTVSNQRKTLYERITKPDMNKTFNMGSMGPVAGGSFHSSTASVKTFQFDQRYSPKPYRTTEYAATKTSWLSRFKFPTSPANTRDYSGPNAKKSADVKAAPTRSATEAGKSADARALPGGKRPYLGPEAAKVKHLVDPEHPPRVSQDLKELKSVEDIRELLNKNK